jgi:hypothetical protein
MMSASGTPTSAGAITAKSCITPQQASSNDLSAPGRGNCKRESLERTGRSVHVRSSCPNRGAVDFVATFSSDTAVDAKVTMKIPSMPAPQVMSMSAKWIGPTCPSETR